VFVELFVVISFTKHLTRGQESEFKLIALQRPIIVSFCATMFLGAFLGLMNTARRVNWYAPGTTSVAYQKRGAELSTGILKAEAKEGWIVVLLPNVPAPLPESASPYLAEIAAANPQKGDIQPIATEPARSFEAFERADKEPTPDFQPEVPLQRPASRR
jgi:hypothetical protein